MRVSKRGEYALRSMINLGIARELGRPMLQIRQLAEKENIPVKFLEAILLELNRAGYLASKRGKGGGYFLKKPMNKITIGEIVRLIRSEEHTSQLQSLRHLVWRLLLQQCRW